MDDVTFRRRNRLKKHFVITSDVIPLPNAIVAFVVAMGWPK